MITSTFITRTLSDIYPGEAEFKEGVISKLNFEMEKDEEEYLFQLMFSRYADSNTRYTNENLFAMNIIKEINVHYPTILAIIKDQKKLRNMTDAELVKGGRMITNIGAHNSAAIGTDTTEGIKQLDTQQVNNSERAKFDTLIIRMEQYRSGAEDRFLNQFTRYFVQIIYPQRDLIFVTKPGQIQIEEGDY